MHGTYGGPSFKRTPAAKGAAKKPPPPKKGSATKAKPPAPKGRKP